MLEVRKKNFLVRFEVPPNLLQKNQKIIKKFDKVRVRLAFNSVLLKL